MTMDSLSWREENYEPTSQATCKRWDRNQRASSSYSGQSTSAGPRTFKETARDTAVITTFLQELRYDPTLWLLRAQLLLDLGYPELAAGDACKARLLLEAASDPKNPLYAIVRLTLGMALYLNWHSTSLSPFLKDSTEFTLTHNPTHPLATQLQQVLHHHHISAYRLLSISLQHANAFTENLALCKAATQEFGPPPNPTDPWSPDHIAQLKAILHAKRAACERAYAGDAEQIETAMQNGCVLARRYPWMGDGIVVRESGVVDGMAREIDIVSRGACALRRSDMPGGGYGAFATRRIRRGELVMTDYGSPAVTASMRRCAACCGYIGGDGDGGRKGTALSCCAERFCSTICADQATKSSHGATCGSSFDFLRPDANEIDLSKRTTHTSALMLQRYIAIAVQHCQQSKLAKPAQDLAPPVNPQQHPLTTCAPIARLTATYTGNTPRPWRLQTDIIDPIRVLQTLGVNPFACPEFDTWVLHTIRLRIENNQAMQFVCAEGSEAPAGSREALGGEVSAARREPPRDGVSVSGNISATESTGKRKTFIQAMYPTHSATNHSCAPNIHWEHHDRVAALRMRALRDVSSGEELLHSYAEVEELGVEERKGVLAPWLGEGCGCGDCVREGGGGGGR